MTAARPSNRPLGLWFGFLFLVPGVVAAVMGVVGLQFGLVLWGGAFAAAGATMVVLTLRSHHAAVPAEDTVAALHAAGIADTTAGVREHTERLPPAVRDHLRLDRRNHPEVAFRTGIHPTAIQAAGSRPTTVGPVHVVEAWQVTSTSKTNDRVTGGTVEPRVVAWTPLPADIGTVTIRPDNARMRLADLTNVADDHTVDWDAVDRTWHLHGDDEALLRAVIDIGMMGRLTELAPTWIVQVRDGLLLVVPTAERNRLTAKPPTLSAVADEIVDVVVRLRTIMPQMLWDDLDGFLSPYRAV